MVVTSDLVKKAIDQEIASVKKRLGDKYGETKFDLAQKYLWDTVQGKEYAEFLTTQMYDSIVDISRSRL